MSELDLLRLGRLPHPRRELAFLKLALRGLSRSTRVARGAPIPLVDSLRSFERVGAEL
jgi:hypothetical protein